MRRFAWVDQTECTNSSASPGADATHRSGRSPYTPASTPDANFKLVTVVVSSTVMFTMIAVVFAPPRLTLVMRGWNAQRWSLLDPIVRPGVFDRLQLCAARHVGAARASAAPRGTFHSRKVGAHQHSGCGWPLHRYWWIERTRRRRGQSLKQAWSQRQNRELPGPAASVR